MAHRIGQHRSRRPSDWQTLEESLDIAGKLAVVGDHEIVLLDCLTLWVSNLLLADEKGGERSVLAATDRLLKAYDSGSASWVVVTSEVGLGIVPETPLGRVYRDALGRVNQAFAQRADKVFLVVAGLALDLRALGAVPVSDMLAGTS
jgi:adenosylcobinamide kinase/adenosylcobinamide-phosphate guanylyltransferase